MYSLIHLGRYLPVLFHFRSVKERPRPCIKYEDINTAWWKACQDVPNLRKYPGRDLTDQELAALGTALQETSRILAKK